MPFNSEFWNLHTITGINNTPMYIAEVNCGYMVL